MIHIQDLRSRLFRVEPELAQVMGLNPSVEEPANQCQLKLNHD